MFTKLSSAPTNSPKLILTLLQLAIYETKADAVADSYLHVGGSFLARCKQASESATSIFKINMLLLDCLICKDLTSGSLRIQ